jgi:hypothetical protein
VQTNGLGITDKFINSYQFIISLLPLLLVSTKTGGAYGGGKRGAQGVGGET